MTNAAQILALTKAIKKAAADTARNDLKPGTYDIKMLAAIEMKMTVGDDYNQNIVAKADPWILLHAAMSKLNGVTVASLTRDAEKLAEGNAGLISSLKKEAASAIGEIKDGTSTSCRGKVTTSQVVVELIDTDSDDKSVAA